MSYSYTRLDQEEVIMDFHALNSMEPAKHPQEFGISHRARSGGLKLPHPSKLSSLIHIATSERTNLGKKSMQRAGLELWKDDEGGATKIAAP
ncbi:hypothetical protein FSHL1_003158 [Fusarium sambucinum]